MSIASEPKKTVPVLQGIPTRAVAVKIALWYAAVASLWILCSGWGLHRLASDPELETFLEALKGWFFVAVTAILLGVAIDRFLRRSTRLLQESEQRWQYALEGAGQGVWDWNVQTHVVFFSDHWKAMLGYEPGEIGHSVAEWESRIHPGDLPRVIQEVQRHLEGHTETYRTEHRLRCKDGSHKWILTQGKVMSRTPDGKPLRVLGTHSDISERKRAEEALRESEMRYRAIWEVGSDVFWVFDLSTQRFPYVSTAIEKLRGYTPEEVSQQTLDEALTPDSIAFITEHLPIRIAAFEAGDPSVRTQMNELGQRCRDGSTVQTEVVSTLITNEQGRVTGIQGITRNITERKRFEQALRESEMRYRLVSENGSDVIWLFDLAANHFTFVSPSVQRLRGFTVEEVMRQTMQEALTPESFRFVAENLPARLAAFAAGDNVMRTQMHEVTQPCKDGTIVPTEVVTTLITNEQGKVTHIQGVTRNITERKRLEEQLRQAQKLEAIGQLAGGVAHDFNNILAASIMQLGLLQMKPNLDVETREALVDLEKGSQRAARLTQQLLMFSRRSVLSVRPVDVNDVMRNLLKMLGRFIGEHIDLRFEGNPQIPAVEADSGMLEQVVVNLVVNARDALPRGGRITIHTTLSQLDEHHVSENSERRRGQFVCLSVADTGLGMDEATQKRIFEPFFTTKEVGKGTGLGLATVHGIVAQHNGWLEVESAVGKGSTFRVFLPALPGLTTPTRTPESAHPVQRGRETVLLVEDEPPVRRVVARSLRDLGYHVLEAGNGHEAMTIWQQRGGKVDLLFTDMVMPEGMSGLDLAESLRLPKPDLKVIISSGYSADILHSGGTTSTGVVYLPKPFDQRILAVTVRNCLDQKPGQV